jgi:hypothetical protein
MPDLVAHDDPSAVHQDDGNDRPVCDATRDAGTSRIARVDEEISCVACLTIAERVEA